MRRSRSYVMRLIRVFDSADTPLQSHEALARLVADFGEAEAVRWNKASAFNIGDLIAELRELHVIESMGGEDGPWVSTARWRYVPDAKRRTESGAQLGDSRKGLGVSTGTPGGPGGPRGPDGPLDGDNGQGAGGLGEVLQHDVLFCFDDEALDAALDICLLVHEG